MAEAAPFMLHLSVAEQGKLHLLDGRHVEALRHFREAIRIAVSARAPEIFFRHYTQCVLECLELSGDYEEIISFCRDADAHYQTIDKSEPLLAKDHGALLERMAVALLLSERREEAVEALGRALAVAGEGALPLAETLAGWLSRGFAVTLPLLRDAQRRHKYFVVRRDSVDRRIARPLPPPRPGGHGAAALLGA
jgi:tetratricopeptide (TPR) repeat protein